MSEHEETIYAVRRTDREGIGDGDYSFLIVPDADDWGPAEEESDHWDEPVEYELVRMTVEVVGRRTFPVCAGCNEPARYFGLCEAHAREDDPEAFEEANQ